MKHPIPRRSFLGSTAAGIAFASQIKPANAHTRRSANNVLTVGVMGVNGRGSALAKGFAQQPDVEVAYVCDVDSRARDKGVGVLEGVQERKPVAVEDYREMLDDKSLDILVVAAPNHWHAPATIAGCQAGKHVYVEKPCSHTAQEGEWAVKAARDNDRVVTMGSQRRSRDPIMKAIQRVHEGAIGTALYARTWYNNRRDSIGVGKTTSVPSWLNYELWQGPCTEHDYKDNLIHYNWHWHWHWGNGELGNNGVHALDVARWGLDVDYPTKVSSGGGRYRYQDDQQTADTHLVTYEFDNRMITWEGLSWSPYGPGGSRFGVSFHGEEKAMLVFDSGYKIFDAQNKLVEEESGAGGDAEHFDDFLRCIREGGRPAADIEDGHKSTLMCHLGNIAHLTGQTLHTDPTNGHIKDQAISDQYWSKEYREGWAPRV